MFDIHSKTVEISGKEMKFETGLIARQAGGAVTVQYGDSVTLVTCTIEESKREGIDFLPLTCDYIAKTYAAGKIPGGFFKREGKLTEMETLTSRMIDRPTRPLFPKGYQQETQIVAFVLSHDKVNDTDVLAMNGASCAAMISDAPFEGPYGAVRVGRIDGELVANPTFEQRDKSDIQLIVAATREAICMVEGGFEEVSESDLLDALDFAHQSILPILDAQEALAAEVAKQAAPVEPPEVDEALHATIFEKYDDAMKTALLTEGKLERRKACRALRSDIIADLIEDPSDKAAVGQAKKGWDILRKKVVRKMALTEQKRIDGRGPAEIREIDVRVGVLPRTHGSALFTRGETQALVVTTLGTGDDAQRIEYLEADQKRTFILHYNFPPFSVNEVRFMRGPGRREIGHGALAHRALDQVMPNETEYPYVVRVVSDITESNGSSSMASVCGGSLSMMDAGGPMKRPIAGIAMGLIKEGDDYVVLTDIMGDEDHMGDMDFKVAGSADGITAFQMDTKIGGISREIMTKALAQAKDALTHLLGKMATAIDGPREGGSPYAPRIHTIMIHKDKIRDIIGPGGKVIRGIVEQTGCKVDVDDTGRVQLSSPDEDACNKAIKMVQEITQEAEIGKLYLGLVKKITDFGAFVEIFPGTDGLVHISQLAKHRVERVEDIVREGDEVLVRCIDVDRRSGKIRLSRKDALDADSE